MILFFSVMTALLSFIAVIFLVDQFMYKPKAYKVVWAIGLFVYGVAGLAQTFAVSSHWTLMEYRVWFLTGAILAAPYLGMGTFYLLGPKKWANGLMTVIGAFSLYALYRTLTVSLTSVSGIPANETPQQWITTASFDAVVNTGKYSIMPNDIVFVIIVLNSLGALTLVGGAAWSAWKLFRTHQNGNRFISMVLIVIGGLAPTAAGTLTKSGVSGAFYLLTFVGALFLLAGYLVSIDVATVFRVPFTKKILINRESAAVSK